MEGGLYGVRGGGEEGWKGNYMGSSLYGVRGGGIIWVLPYIGGEEEWKGVLPYMV